MRPGRPRPTREYRHRVTATSLTVGANGPILMQDHYVLQKMAQFNRERVPERVVHAKGGGAHGTFECAEDVSQLTPDSG